MQPRPQPPWRTRLLVLQATPFCNVACSYCYLPDRGNRSRMSLDTVQAAVRWVFDNGLADDPPPALVWHAGEPLVLPVEWYEAAHDAIDAVIPVSMQTNGMLIDERWCGFFARRGINVGISLDGPADLHDARRRTRSGHGTHDRVMRGIDLLRRHGIPFHVICVIGRETLEAADCLMDFFIDEGIERIGFNVEEIEGVNGASSLDFAGVANGMARFFGRVVERAAAAPFRIAVREVEQVRAGLADPRFGRRIGNAQNTPFEILSVSWRGDLSTFSPELLSQRDQRFEDFILGNVHDTALADIIAGDLFNRLWSEIREGVAACHSACPYARLCGGGAPANKLAECGTFAATETMACRLGQMAPIDVVLAQVERELQSA